MNKKLNEVLLNRRSAIIIDKTEKNFLNEDYKKAIIATTSVNLQTLGYRLSLDLATELLSLPVADIVNTATFLTDTIRHNLGGDVEYHPMYPGFPESVLSRTDAQLYFDALVYAVTGFEVLPFDMPKEIREKELAKEISKLKTIDLADIETAKDIASNLMSSSVSFSQDDKTDLLTINDSFKDFRSFIPKSIPNKENLTWLAAEYMQKVNPKNNPFVKKIRSATDLLRLMIARSGGETSLVEHVKFKSLPKSEVRVYAELLPKLKNVEADMYRRPEMFKKMNETYHFRSLKIPELNVLLDKLYAKEIERSFLSKRDAAIKEGNFSKLVGIYKSEPGQMGADITRLALLAQNEKNYDIAKAALCSNFRMNAESMAPLNLLKVNSVLKSRLTKNDYAIYSPKKGLGNPYIKPDERSPLRNDMVVSLSTISKYTLAERYSSKRPLGKVYIEEGLRDIRIPSQQRTNSKGSTGMSFGSKFPLQKDVNCLRSFIWWTNSEKSNYVDVDLSAAFYDKDFKKLKDISYYNLYENGYGVHSGDLRNGGPVGGAGAAEFIDIDLEKLSKNHTNAAFVMFSVRIYSGDNFADTPCKFGWMESDNIPAKLFDITKVEKSIELNTESTRSIPVLFDINERKMIWLDRNPRENANYTIKNLNSLVGGNNNITYVSSDIVEAYRALNTVTPDLYTLMKIHARARGEIVDNPNEADTIFTVERVSAEEYPNAKEFVCAYDNDKILGDLVPSELSTLDMIYFKELELEQRAAESISVHEGDEQVI